MFERKNDDHVTNGTDLGCMVREGMRMLLGYAEFQTPKRPWCLHLPSTFHVLAGVGQN